MLQIYSDNITVALNSAVNFNSYGILKGNTAVAVTPSSVQLNKKGVYMVSVDAVAEASTTLQLMKDGVLVPQALSTGTTIGFETLVQVPYDNSCSCASIPTSIQLINTGAEATLTHVNMVVTKLC